jgi:hypothetical protein
MLYQPPTGGAANDSYVGANPGAGIQGSRVPPKALEQHQRELIALITKSGLTPSDSVLTQVSAAVRSQALNYVATVGGTANAITATLDPAPADWSELVGMPLRCYISTPNTSSATGAVTGLSGTKPIVRNDNGAALEGGEIVGISTFIYDGTALRLQAVPRLRTPRVVVPSGGVTITAASEYTTYVMDLSVRQAFTLPSAASMPIGFRVTLETTNLPSGYQTAYVDVSGGGNLFYRGNGTTAFYLIGAGEVFEFVNTGAQWLVRLVSQPAGTGVYRTATTQPATFVPYTAYADLITDTSSGQPSLFQITAGTIRVPVSGVYNVFAGAVGYGSTASFYAIDVCVFDNTGGSLLTQLTQTIQTNQTHTVHFGLAYTQYYPAGTLLLLAARGPGGNVVLQGNSTQFSVFLTGR